MNIRKLGKKFRAPGDNRTHDPQSSSSNAVITEILEFRKLGKKFRAPGDNRTHDPQSSSSNAVITEILEALWRAGSQFNSPLRRDETGHHCENFWIDNLNILLP